MKEKWESESLGWIHEIRRQIQKENEGLTPEQIIAKTKAETDPIIRQYGLKVRKPAGDQFAGLVVRDKPRVGKSRTGR